MGNVIARRLLLQKVVAQKDLILCDRNRSKMDNFNKGIEKSTNPLKAIQNASIIILAIKPQDFLALAKEIKDRVSANNLVISIMAGISLATLEKSLGNNMAIVRAMPNLALQYGLSITGWIANKKVTPEQKKFVQKLFSLFGEQIELAKEDFVDKVTAISGSGPAYFFYLAELLEEKAKQFGFSTEVATLLSRYTFFGAVEVVKNSTSSFVTLKDQVVSKGGTTETALKHLNDNKFREIFQEGIEKAYVRARQLSRSYDGHQ